MKKFIMGLIVGIAITITGSVFADEGLQKIEAYLRPSLPIILNGTPVPLEKPPVMYDGSTYVGLRELARLTGAQVKWNDATQAVEITSSGRSEPLVATTPDPNTWKNDPAFVRAQKITDLQKKLRIMQDEVESLSNPVISHERQKIYNQELQDDDTYLQAKKAYEAKQTEYKTLDEQLQTLQKEAEQYYEQQKAALQP